MINRAGIPAHTRTVLARTQRLQQAGAAAVVFLEEGDRPRPLGREEGPSQFKIPVLSMPLRVIEAACPDLPARAKDLIFTGRFVKADEALAIGLVDRVVPAAEVYDAAVAWAGQFSGAASLAIRAAKECVDRGLEVDLETGLEIERQQFASLFATEDRSSGMDSFVENGPGKATFAGR